VLKPFLKKYFFSIFALCNADLCNEGVCNALKICRFAAQPFHFILNSPEFLFFLGILIYLYRAPATTTTTTTAKTSQR
jgi:hypothetical protein